MRVPPDQSSTAWPRAARAVGVAAGGSRVTRVSRVPNTNASTRARAATEACMYISSMRE